MLESVSQDQSTGCQSECSRAGQKGAAGVRLATITTPAVLLSLNNDAFCKLIDALR